MLGAKVCRCRGCHGALLRLASQTLVTNLTIYRLHFCLSVSRAIYGHKTVLHIPGWGRCDTLHIDKDVKRLRTGLNETTMHSQTLTSHLRPSVAMDDKRCTFCHGLNSKINYTFHISIKLQAKAGAGHCYESTIVGDEDNFECLCKFTRCILLQDLQSCQKAAPLHQGGNETSSDWLFLTLSLHFSSILTAYIMPLAAICSSDYTLFPLP